MENQQALPSAITHAIKQRRSLVKETNAYRLFNGFYEGIPGLVLDRYGSALVLFNHTEKDSLKGGMDNIADWALDHLEGVDSVLLKQRKDAENGEEENGIVLAGQSLPESIFEYGVRYALDLQINQDASFYLDTRGLRRWLLSNTAGRRVLNTFAYTGSLGVAAGAGGAARVVQTDLSLKYLRLAEASWRLNGFDMDRCEIVSGDFFRVSARLRHARRLFDCVILDPPFFSETDAGRVDLQTGTTRLINKVRPLVAHEGVLIVINNALFLSGADFKAELDQLCESDYLTFEGTLPVPEDVTGYPETVVDAPPVYPAPFNHPTKIALLRVFRKDKRR